MSTHSLEEQIELLAKHGVPRTDWRVQLLMKQLQTVQAAEYSRSLHMPPPGACGQAQNIGLSAQHTLQGMAQNQMGQAASYAGQAIHSPWNLGRPPPWWERDFIFSKFSKEYPELAEFIKAAAALLECEVQCATSPFSSTIAVMSSGRLKDMAVIWSIVSPKFDVRVQWLETKAPVDEPVWREKFAEIAELIKEERVHLANHPPPAASQLPIPAAPGASLGWTNLPAAVAYAGCAPSTAYQGMTLVGLP